MSIVQGSAGAAESASGTVADVTRGLIELSTDVLQAVPITGLQEAARLVSKIWEAVEAVKVCAVGPLALTID